MLSYKSKNRFLSLILVLVLTFTITLKPVQVQADPITITAISLKVVATVLASMGVLAYVESQTGGIELFFNNMRAEYQRLFNNDLTLVLFDIFKNSILSKAKMKLADFSNFLKEFIHSQYNEIALDDSSFPTDFDIPSDYIKSYSVQGSGTVINNFYSKLNSRGSGHDIFNISISDNLNLIATVHKDGYGYYSSSHATFLTFQIYIYDKVTNAVNSIRIGDRIASYNDSVISVSASQLGQQAHYIDVSDDGLVIVNSFYSNWTNGKKQSVTMTGQIPLELVNGEIPRFNNINVVARDIPSDGLAFPVGLTGVNVNDFVGQKLDDLIGTIASSDLYSFLNGLRTIPRDLVNELPIAGVDVNEDDDVVGGYFPDIPVDVPVDVPVNPTFPFTLKGLIDALLDMLKKLFIPSDGIILEQVKVLESIIKQKVGPNIYIPFFDELKSLRGEPIPDLYILGSKVLDASYVNNIADLVKSWQRWFYYILIMLVQLNNVYKLIRSGEMINRAGGVK